jgi:hypothetical protein
MLKKLTVQNAHHLSTDVTPVDGLDVAMRELVPMPFCRIFCGAANAPQREQSVKTTPRFKRKTKLWN